MKPLTLAEKKQFFNSIESLYTAGFSYTDVFRTIETSSTNTKIKNLCRVFRNGIESGIPINELMIQYKEIVSPQYAMLFCAGDKSGRLEDSIARIKEDIQRTEMLKSSLIASLTYPTLLFLGSIGVLIFCHSFFFKVFDVMYTTGMCPATKFVLFITAIFKVALAYGLIFFAVYYFVSDKKRYEKLIDYLTEKTFLAPIVNGVYFTNFFYVLASCYDAGIPILEAIEQASSIFKNKRCILGSMKTISMLKKGSDISSAFVSSEIYSPYAISQIAVGEKTGRLGKAFKDIAQDYENKLKDTLNIIMAWLQPATIVIVGLIVAYIAITFYKRLYGSMFNAF